MLGANAVELRRQLTALRGRIERAGLRDSVLLVYYSGHGDAQDLHLSGSRLPLRELDQLLRAIPVATLVTIVDTCRNGPNGVRRKGAQHSDAFDVRFARDVGPSGRVTITAGHMFFVPDEELAARLPPGPAHTHRVLRQRRVPADSRVDGQLRRLDREHMVGQLYH